MDALFIFFFSFLFLFFFIFLSALKIIFGNRSVLYVELAVGVVRLIHVDHEQRADKVFKRLDRGQGLAVLGILAPERAAQVRAHVQVAVGNPESARRRVVRLEPLVAQRHPPLDLALRVRVRRAHAVLADDWVG